MVVIQRNIILFQQVRGQLRRTKIFSSIVPLIPGSIEARVLDTDRVVIIPAITNMEGNIFLMKHLIHRAIGIDDVVNAVSAFDILEDTQTGVERSLNVMNIHI